MKTFKFVVLAFVTILFVPNTFAQTPAKSIASKTETIKVSGNCGMCKDRIEAAAKVAGVAKADWDKSTKILTLAYNSAIVKSDDIQKKIAAVGHDTEKYKADSKTYNSLPGCCKYR
ncbi:MAG: ATPase [Prolixibacteraceae bacterium]|nr:ATPase [Prolixibacteraceae bacterium]